MRVLGRAKLNLHLAVKGSRPDGYHDLEMVMQTVELADELRLTPSDETEVTFRFGRRVRRKPPDRPDLVERAVEMYRRRLDGGGAAARVDVLKRIPLASGLAGGSADAAAALLGMDALARGALTPALPEMAAALGSDVPFALHGGTCRATSRGERLEPVPCPERLWWVLGISRFGVGTPDVFRQWDVLGPVGEPPEAGPLLAALADGDPRRIGPLLHNDLARAARALEPRLAALEDAMRAAGVLGSAVSGSGPTVMGLCADEDHAREAADPARAAFDRVEVAASAPVGAEVVSGSPVTARRRMKHTWSARSPSVNRDIPGSSNWQDTGL